MKKYTLLFLLVALCNNSWAQSIYFPANSEVKHLVDKLETINGSFSDRIYTNSGKIAFTDIADYFIAQKNNSYEALLSNADIYDVNKYLRLSLAYKDRYNFATYQTDGKVEKTFFKNSPFLYENYKNHISFALTPKVALQLLSDEDGNFKYHTGIGFSAFSNIKNRIGFYVDATYNYEKPPTFFLDKINKYNSVPNVGPFQRNNNSFGYLMVDAHTSVDVLKDYVTINAGYGKHFIGDGYRSLILSDYAAPYPYLTLRTNIWKFQYTNYFINAKQQDVKYDLQDQGDNKYVAIHYLTANVTRWLNLGVFETVTSTRNGMMELSYFNPVIFYRAMERQLGSPDKMAIGFTGKAIIAKTAQAYGQFFINELVVKEFFGNNKYIHNKWGLQLGAKYFNAFGVDNMELMAEMNIVRPYAYQHRSLSNFSHFNQPLAHPLGAGFREFIFGFKSRPHTKLGINLNAIYYQQAIDSTMAGNNGSDILKNINNNSGRYGIKMINGEPMNMLIMQGNVSYQIKPHLYWEIGGAYRSHLNSSISPIPSDIYFFTGARYFMDRRNFFQF